MATLGQETSQWMRARAEVVGQISPTVQFEWHVELSSLLNPNSKEDWKAQFGKHISREFQSIYIISALDSNTSDAIFEAFIHYKNYKDGMALARSPKDKPCSERLCLYVGSSHKTANRLMEHLGFGARTTYSLQMIHWAKNLSGYIKIEVYGYDNIPAPDLCALEDYLSLEKLKPIFGRRGSL